MVQTTQTNCNYGQKFFIRRCAHKTHSTICPSICACIQLLFYSSIIYVSSIYHPSTRACIQPFIYPSIHSFYWSLHLCIHPYIHAYSHHPSIHPPPIICLLCIPPSIHHLCIIHPSIFRSIHISILVAIYPFHPIYNPSIHPSTNPTYWVNNWSLS